MKKVIIDNSGSIDDVIEMLDKEGLYLNNGYDFDFIKEEMLKGGSGIYRFVFGCRGGLEEFDNSDEYMSKEELIEEFKNDNNEEDLKYYEDMLDEFYSDDDNNSEVDGKFNFVKCVGYFEEGWDLFVKVKV